MSLILPAAISEDMIVPSLPFGILTNVIVFVTFFTLQSIRFPSSIDFLRNLVYLKFHKTSSTFARIFAFPDDGSAKTALQPRHLTFVEAFPKIV